jgi:predicted TIM-barrel fold metal-dependent hydrolase
MITRRVLVGAAVGLTLAIGIAIAQAPQGAQSQGALQQRPGADRQPEFPLPNIREYKPKSTLVVPQHPTPRAKFPVIDIHSHQPAPISDAQMETLVKSMDPLNLQVLVNASGVTGETLQKAVAALRASRYKDRMVQFTDIDWGRGSIAPGFGQRAARQLEADVKAGALGVGEIMKGFGISIMKSDGTRLKIDDPELDPIWDTAARLNIPVFIHTADPQEFWEPIDNSNERLLELSLYRNRRYQDPKYPRFETLMAERDNLFRKHPKTTFITAHLGWHGNISPAWARCSTRCRTSTRRSARCCTTSADSRVWRTTSWSSTRIEFCSARTTTSPTSSRTSGAPWKQATSTSITTATITPSGSCTGWRSPIKCCASSITRTR